jgi:hypothetical protein
MTLNKHCPKWCSRLIPAAVFLVVCGCYNTPWERYDPSRAPTPLGESCGTGEDCSNSYEDSLTGGQIFNMYCSYCHNARPVAERPFSNYQNVAAHMRVRANLTGKEYAKIVAWMRQMHDVPSPIQEVEPSPKRFYYNRPINELQSDAAKAGEKAMPPMGQGAAPEAQ